MTVRDRSSSPTQLSAPPFERAGGTGAEGADRDFLLSVWTRRNGRDLASDEIWEESVMRARLKRQAAAHRPLLSQARSLTVSLVAAAATAAAPAAGLAHPRSSSGGVAKSAKRTALERGDRGSRVAQLQRLLGIPADGVFGPKTRAAVRAFQSKHGLTVDGIVGPETWSALTSGAKAGGAKSGGAKSGDGVLELGDRGSRVAQLQRLLGIPADGVFGPKTRAAVRAFQSKHGLTVDGKVGPQTWAALTSGGGATAPSTPAPTAPTATGAAQAVRGVDRRLWGSLALARKMGLSFMSGHRPGSSIGGSGKRSDHSYYPSKAVDVGGSAANMRRYARAVAGNPGVQTVIYGPVGIWIAGIGWRPIGSSGTYRDHLDHVHVDTF